MENLFKTSSTSIFSIMTHQSNVLTWSFFPLIIVCVLILPSLRRSAGKPLSGWPYNILSKEIEDATPSIFPDNWWTPTSTPLRKTLLCTTNCNHSALDLCIFSSSPFFHRFTSFVEIARGKIESFLLIYMNCVIQSTETICGSFIIIV